MTPRERLHTLLLCSAITETVNRAKADIAKLEKGVNDFRLAVVGEGALAVPDGAITTEMIEAAARSVDAHLQLFEIDEPSVCAEIAKDALRAALGREYDGIRAQSVRDRVADAARRIIEMEQ